MLRKPSEVARSIGTTTRTVIAHIRRGRYRADVVNGRYRVDTDTLHNARDGRYRNPELVADTPVYVPVIARIAANGVESVVSSYRDLSIRDRQSVDAWCKSRGIESPSHYI